MESDTLIAVGIDVSKGKSTVAARSPGGEIVLMPFEIEHTSEGFQELLSKLHALNGTVRIIMEHTGAYWQPVARALRNCGFYVSVVNAMLIHDFSDNSLRKIKTDKADSLKIAHYGLTFWETLNEYSEEDETRQLLKMQSRLYERTLNTSVMLRNGLIALVDQTFPNADKLFKQKLRNAAGHIKWVDFVCKFWHKDCVATVSKNAFTEQFRKWCKRTGYRFSLSDAETIYAHSKNCIATLNKNNSTKILIKQAAESLNAVYDSLQALRSEMDRLASLLPEYDIVMDMQGIGKITGPQLIAEIGDVRKFKSKSALVAFAGVDAPPFQSGAFDAKTRHVSKRGSPHLRKTIFEIAAMIYMQHDSDNPIYAFMAKKRDEGKHYYVYIIAGAAKFLRVYYARVTEYLNHNQ